jgi:predicted enzyme related to lactoylglutathione lyase
VALRFEETVLDCNDPKRVGAFWAELLGNPLGGPDDEGDYWIAPADGGPEMIFVAVPEAKAVKNRLHIDLRPDDQDYEVDRAIALGARHVDVGQREVSWVVLADPEGNEFCILRAKMPEEA